VIELANEWGMDIKETQIPIKSILDAANDGHLLEIFGTGTAATIVPIGNILYKDKLYSISNPDDDPDSKEFLSSKFLKHLSDIQYGKIVHPWSMDISQEELWSEQTFSKLREMAGYHAELKEIMSKNM